MIRGLAQRLREPQGPVEVSRFEAAPEEPRQEPPRGRVDPDISHDELVRLGGRYAQMYATWISHSGLGRTVV